MAPKRLSTVSDFAAAERADSKLVVVHFFAEWAPQCNSVDDVLDELARLPEVRSAGVEFYSCPAEDLPEIAQKYGVEAVPTVILIKKCQIVDRVDGVDLARLSTAVKVHSHTAGAQDLDARLTSLINKHPIMVFMKGDRNAPRCGFSKTLMQILNDTKVEYCTFDILDDEEVRQGLKKFSNWPTYPQVYVKGELIGGLDIIKELLNCGELEKTLKA